MFNLNPTTSHSMTAVSSNDNMNMEEDRKPAAREHAPLHPSQRATSAVLPAGLEAAAAATVAISVSDAAPAVPAKNGTGTSAAAAGTTGTDEDAGTTSTTTSQEPAILLSHLPVHDISSEPAGSVVQPNKSPAQPKQLVRKWPSLLMKCIAENGDDEWALVMERIQSHPQEILVQGVNGGQNALHAACFRYPPSHVVEAMLAAKPEAALYQNFSGETPLHLASYSASEDVQGILARAAPATVSAQDQYGDCPLHFAARSGATFQLMEQLLHAAPNCVSLLNKRGVTPFWLLPRSYLEAEDLEEILDEQAEDYCDDWDLLVLFLRYAHFGADPPAPTREDGQPLYDWMVHAAAATPACPRETLKFICNLFPEQALRYNERGMTPLLLAIQAPEMKEPKHWDENEDGFREHVEAAILPQPNAVTDELPSAATAAVAEHVDTEYLERALQEDEADEASEESVVSILLEWNRRAIVYGDEEGRLPLSHALLNGKPWHMVRRLIQACPRSLETRDRPSGGLFMFQLAAMKSPELDTVYTLSRSLPELIAMTRRCRPAGEDAGNPIQKKPRCGSYYAGASPEP